MRAGSGAGVVLVGALAVDLVLASCSSSASAPAPSGASSPSGASTTASTAASPSPAASPAASVATTLPAVRAWSPGRGELHPEVKKAATAFIEAAGTWDDGSDAVGGSAGGSATAVAARVRAQGVSRAAARDAARLADDDAVASTLDVVYPQFGGLNSTSASVMLLAEQSLRSDSGATSKRTLIFDVRLARDGSSATVTGIEPPVERDARGGPSRIGRAVLANPNIVLHAPAIADIRSGDTQDSVLQVLTTMARRHTLEILELHTGHPHNVYATDRTSNHTEGRAADIWRIDGIPVVRAPHALLVSVLREAGAAGATEVGGPFDLNGGGPGYFSDETHSDHIHVGVTPDRPKATP